MINSIVAFFTAIVTFFSGCFSGLVDAVFFPESPQTESVEFAKSIGNGSDFRLFDRTTHTLEFPDYIKP